MPYAVAAAVVSAAGSMYSSNKSAKEQARASKRGIEAEERIANRNLEFQREMAEQVREDFAPWREVGEDALNRIWSGVESGEFEVGDIDVTRDPGYRFRMQEGVDALDASAAARGRLLSGAQQKGVTEYAQNIASDEYGRAYNREADKLARRFNILSGLSGSGQASAARQAGATSQLASTGGNILSSLGHSKNVARQNIGASRAGAYEDYGKAANQAMQNWMTYRASQ